VTVRLEPNTGQSSVNPDGEVCAICRYWAPLIVTSAIRPKRTKQLIRSNCKNERAADIGLINRNGKKSNKGSYNFVLTLIYPYTYYPSTKRTSTFHPLISHRKRRICGKLSTLFLIFFFNSNRVQIF
jgi:hypothetical protein